MVGVGFLLSDALAQVAQRFPDKNFVGIDTFAQSIVKQKSPANYPLPNFMDVVYEEHKGSALVGTLANDAGGPLPEAPHRRGPWD